MALYKGTTKLDGGGGGGATYTAGLNIQISPNNVISATDTTYTAGTNVSIDVNNIISATDTTYTAGEGIAILNGPDYSAMRGPCSEGFHIPTVGEWQSLVLSLNALGIDITNNTGLKTYCKIPASSYRKSSNGEVSQGDVSGYYWTCNAYENGADRSYRFLTSSMSWDGLYGRAAGMNIRPFKDFAVIPDSGWTTLIENNNGGIYRDTTNGLISISNYTGGWITISDKNLGATQVYDINYSLSDATVGYYYQWGNNYGFPASGNIETSSTQIDTTGYGPGNYYSSSTFIIGNIDWSSVDNKNLRGGVTGVITHNNAITNAGVLSVNGQTGDVVVDGGNTKTFYITNVGDSQVAIDEAQPILDWYLDGKNPVINWNDCIWIMTESRLTGTPKQLYFKRNKPEFSNNSLGYGTSLLTDELCINFVNDTVQETIHFNGNRYVDFLETHTDYLVPYEPLYQGSPATKKYVDDNINTKTFYLSSTSDLTTAQAAVDWIITGKTAFILFNGAVYKQRDRNTSGGNERFFFSTDDNSTVQNTNLGNTVIKHLELQINSDETTHIVSTISASEKYLGKYINIDGSYSEAFVPTQDYHPATKKYVDDGDTKIASTAPSNPTEGMLWYDTTNDVLKSYDGTNWNEVGGETYTAGEGISIGNISDYSAMRGPAPDGFHIPQKTEREAICDILTVTFGLASNGNMLKTYLYMPRPGNRYYTTSDVNGPGTEGYYWCCTAYDGGSSYVLNFNSASITYPQNGFARSYGYSLRCFKDVPVIPTASWNILYDGSSVATGAGVFQNSTSGLISVSGDGQNWITIMDKNLGATSTDTTSTDSYGYYYQWGNNYGFPTTGTVTTSSTQVDTTGYGPGNYYSDNTFVIGSRNRSSTQNNNLWGGVTGVVTLNNVINNIGVLSVNGQTGNVTVASGIQNDTTGTTTTVTKIWAGTESEFALITPTSGVEYHVYPN